MNSLSDDILSGADPSKQSLSKLVELDMYPNSIEAIVDSNTFLTTLSSSIDTQGNKIEPGEIPGEKAICGSVNGNRFKLRKAGAFSNPCSKDLVGVVNESATGAIIKYNLVARPITTLIQTTGFIALLSLGLFCLSSLFINLNYVPIDRIGRIAFFSIGLPLFLLIAFISMCKIGDRSGESDQEELLDHIKKIAAGISVSS